MLFVILEPIPAMITVPNSTAATHASSTINIVIFLIESAFWVIVVFGTITAKLPPVVSLFLTM